MNADDEKEKAVTEQAERDALAAAEEVLLPLRRRESDVGVGEYVKYVLIAIKAVRRVQSAAQELVDEEKHQYVTVDAFHIVATALWSVSNDMVGVDVHPYSIGASPFLGFARACLILEAATNFHILAVDHNDAWMSDCFVDESIEAVTKAEEQDVAEEKAEEPEK